MSTSIEGSPIASRHNEQNHRRMRNPRQKRGEKNRVLDPLLARAISRLDEHMKERGLSQSDVARATKGAVDQGRISRILGGEIPEVSFYVLARVVMAAGLSLDGVVADLPRGDQGLTPLPSSSVIPRSG